MVLITSKNRAKTCSTQITRSIFRTNTKKTILRVVIILFVDALVPHFYKNGSNLKNISKQIFSKVSGYSCKKYHIHRLVKWIHIWIIKTHCNNCWKTHQSNPFSGGTVFVDVFGFGFSEEGSIFSTIKHGFIKVFNLQKIYAEDKFSNKVGENTKPSVIASKIGDNTCKEPDYTANSGQSVIYTKNVKQSIGMRILNQFFGCWSKCMSNVLKKVFHNTSIISQIPTIPRVLSC